MNDLTRIFLALFSEEGIGGMIFDTFKQINLMLSNVDWPQIIKIALFVGLAIGLTILLLLANDKIFAYYNSKRIKKHHLTIRNNGNVPSIFLLRTVDLPKQLAVRFRVGDMPMIWVSRKEATAPRQEESESEAPKQEKQAPAGKTASDTSLVPNLQDPFAAAKNAAEETVNTGRKAVTEVGKKAGTIAGIISSVTSLFGVKSPELQNAQSSLKNVQQQSNEAIQSVNNKLGTVDTLSNQVGSIVPKDAVANAGKSALSGVQQGGPVSGSGGTDPVTGNTMDNSQSSGARDFVFDEEVWRSNLGKVDAEGGDLNYAMSKTIQPGESMQIDVDIMNISDRSDPVSLMYKIEVLQVPQTNLQLAAPKEYVNGIVIYPKISLWSRIMPSALIVAMIVISLQLLAGYSHFVF